MPLTVRLNPETERALNALSRRRGVSRSDVVREALAEYAASERDAPTERGPYDDWCDVIGVVDLGARDPSQTTGEQFTSQLQEKARARRAR